MNIKIQGFSTLSVPDRPHRISEHENELRVCLTGAPDEPMSPFTFPGGLDLRPDDILLIPHFEGYRLRADDDKLPLPSVLPATGTGLSMAFCGVLRGEDYLLIAIISNLDARLRLDRVDGVMKPAVEWLPEMGKFGYDRELRFITGKGGITELCKAYRKIAGEKGLVYPLSERVKKLPVLEKLLGAANVWLWNDDAMDKLYSRDAVYRKPAPEQVDERIRVAREMKAAGMERVLWSVFDENVDRRELEAVKELGFITSFYDIYTDVIPTEEADLIPDTRRVRCETRQSLYPDGIIRDPVGNMVSAWKLMGKDGQFHDQKRICDRAAVSCLRRNLNEQMKPERAESLLDGRFLDVQCVSVHECYDKRHPMTRREAFGYKRELLEELHEHGLFAGTEVGCEDAAAAFDYNEGMLSPAEIRAYDAGRRMTHIYRGDEIDPKLTGFMLNEWYRVPLWELVYHDCVQSYWYWGDSTNCAPELIGKRDWFCELWGLPPIYSFKVSDWDKLKGDIIESYKRTVPKAVSVAGKAMVSFSERDGQQRSEFE